jgi:hypothetical protein
MHRYLFEIANALLGVILGLFHKVLGIRFSLFQLAAPFIALLTNLAIPVSQAVVVTSHLLDLLVIFGFKHSFFFAFDFF